MVRTIMEATKIFGDYSQFVVGEIFFATVSNALKDEFHVVIDGSEAAIKTDLNDLQPLWWFPGIYEKFFLFSKDDGFLRATRMPLVEGLDSSQLMQVYLNDIGETHLIEIPNTEFHNSTFVMPEALKQVPALAFKCRWSEVFVEHELPDDNEFIQRNVFRKLGFEVVQVENDLLTVNVLPYDESSALEETEISNYSLSVDKSEESDKVILKLAPVDVGAVVKESMTPAELKIWDEKPFTTDNALVAVQGFQTHDDDRICKFYDPAIGGCFKGGRCKQIHLSELQDGVCRDSKEVFVEQILEDFPLPVLHSKVKIEITSFISINKFWCRYIKLKPTRNGYTLETLISHMNQPDEIETFTVLKEEPSYHQLVLVKSDVDGKFYRGRVESLPDLRMNVQLLLVDFGVVESTPVTNLYDWCTRFNYLAFQSLEMEIANIELFDGNEGSEAAMERMLEFVEDSKNSLKALIFDNVPVIRCTLYNSKKQDIGEELVAEGFLAARQITPALTAECLPG